MQTITAVTFTTCPLLLLMVAMLFQINFKFVGALVTTPLSFQPTLNALLSLLLIKPYRIALLELLGLRKKDMQSMMVSTVSAVGMSSNSGGVTTARRKNKRI